MGLILLKNQKIIVIGGNAAGPAAAAKAKRVNPDAEVLMIEAGKFISTGTCELPYVLSGDVKDYRNIVFFDPETFYEKKKVKVLVRHRVERIDRMNRVIEVRNLEDDSVCEFEYDKLVITTGATANKIPDIPDDTVNHFHYKTVADYLAVKDYMDKNPVKKVLVFGAGYIGIETAEAFRELKKDVRIVEHEGLPMPSSEPEVQSLVKDVLDKHGVDFYGNAGSTKFIFTGNRITAVNISGRIVECDLVVTSIGFKPNVQLAVSAGLKTGKLGGIITDSRLCTNDASIYAAGDCIEVTEFVTNRNSLIPLATLAHEQGHIAGANAAGAYQIFAKPVKNAAVKIFENTLATVGITSAEAREHGIVYDEVHEVASDIASVMPGSSRVFGKIIYNKFNRRILGAEFFGGGEVTGFANLISGAILMNETMEFLTRINYNYTPPKSPLINILSLLGKKAT